jgi:hypothetical protein
MSDAHSGDGTVRTSWWHELDVSEIAAIGLLSTFILRVGGSAYVLVFENHGGLDTWTFVAVAMQWAFAWDQSLFALIVVLITWWKLEFQFSFEVGEEESHKHLKRIKLLAVCAIIVTCAELIGIVIYEIAVNLAHNFAYRDAVSGVILGLVPAVVAITAIVMANSVLGSVKALNKTYAPSIEGAPQTSEDA